MLSRFTTVLTLVMLAWASECLAGELKAIDSSVWIEHERVAHSFEILDYDTPGFRVVSRRYHHDGRLDFWRVEHRENGLAKWQRLYKEPGTQWEQSVWQLGEFVERVEPPMAVGAGMVIGGTRGPLRVICRAAEGRRLVRSFSRDGAGLLDSMDEGYAVHTFVYESEELVRIDSRDGLDFHRWELRYLGGRLRSLEGLARRFVVSYDVHGRMKSIEEIWRDDSGWRTTTNYYYGLGHGSSELGLPHFDFGYLFDLKGQIRSASEVGAYALAYALREGQCSGVAISR